ncbi:hypothetical protein Fmac_029135 [Flemingia macrophylla]|uniref:Cytochrome P450 n=1 Tax=Flemingia macrophylla TaxID=520843 RepID=A0ABD1L9M4_9FABA
MPSHHWQPSPTQLFKSQFPTVAVMSVSSAIICRVAFGRKYDEEGAERSRFHELLNESQAKFLSFFVSDYIPFLGWIDNRCCLSIDLTDDQIKAIIFLKKKLKMCGNKEFIEEEDVEKLVYLKAVIKETLRFYAPTPLLLREAIRSFTIDGYEIKLKTIVYVNGLAIQRDPEAWKDPEEFYPERFLNNEIDFKGQDFELLPFGAGRRICPGISLGMATV